MKDKIDKLVETRESKAGLYFDYTIQVLILLSVASFTIETLPDLAAETINYLETFELVCIVIFSLEYLIRLYIAKRKLKFIFSFYGIIDLLAILPFYLTFSSSNLQFFHFSFFNFSIFGRPRPHQPE